MRHSHLSASARLSRKARKAELGLRVAASLGCIQTNTIFAVLYTTLYTSYIKPQKWAFVFNRYPASLKSILQMGWTAYWLVNRRVSAVKALCCCSVAARQRAHTPLGGSSPRLSADCKVGFQSRRELALAGSLRGENTRKSLTSERQLVVIDRLQVGNTAVRLFRLGVRRFRISELRR